MKHDHGMQDMQDVQELTVEEIEAVSGGKVDEGKERFSCPGDPFSSLR